MRRKSIRNKIVLWAGLCMFGTLGIVVAYSSVTTRSIALETPRRQAARPKASTTPRPADSVGVATPP